LPISRAEAAGRGAPREQGKAVFNSESVSIWKARKMKKKAEDLSGYNLRLYVAGQTPKSVAALSNLRRLCEKYLSGRYRLDVIDLMMDPTLAQRDGIIAIPTLVRYVPVPIKRIIGDLGNSDRVLTRLGIDVGAEV
jgi:circadian clock protein KaiB